MITAPMESAMRFAPPRSYRVLALVIGYLLLYVGAFHFASLLDQGGFIASLWYPPAGLTAFAMLAFGWAGVALDAAGSAVAVLYAAAWQGAPLSGSELLSRMVLHAASYAAAILPLRRSIGQPAFLAQPAQAGWFLAAAGLGAALVSGAGLLRLRWLGQIDAGHFWSLAATRVVGDFIGIVTLAPILLAALLPWLRRCLRDDGSDPAPRPPVEESDARVRRILLGVTAMSLLLLALGHPPPGLEMLARPLVMLLLLLPLAWISVGGGIRQASLAIFVLSVGLMLLLATQPEQRPLAAEYQLVMIAIAVMGLLLGSTAEARNQARMALQTHAERLEQEIAAKTQDLRSANQELAIKENYLRALIGAAPVGIAQFDGRGQCRYLNAASRALVGCGEDAARDRHFLEFIHPDDRDYTDFMWQTHIADAKPTRLEFRLKNTGAWVSAHWITQTEPAAALSGSIVILTDITEQRRKDQQIWTQAHYDALTDLPNRNLFRERLDQALRQAKRRDQSVALLWIDLDGFKAVNDRLGHAAGDELLQQVAARLNGRMRDSDTVARMGGDEFAVILPAIADRDAAARVADDLTARLAEPFPLKSGTGLISASIGVALYPLHAEFPEALVKCADLAMYAAKNAGKNRFREWQPSAQASPADPGIP